MFVGFQSAPQHRLIPLFSDRRASFPKWQLDSWKYESLGVGGGGIFHCDLKQAWELNGITTNRQHCCISLHHSVFLMLAKHHRRLIILHRLDILKFITDRSCVMYPKEKGANNCRRYSLRMEARDTGTNNWPPSPGWGIFTVSLQRGLQYSDRTVQLWK